MSEKSLTRGSARSAVNSGKRRSGRQLPTCAPNDPAPRICCTYSIQETLSASTIALEISSRNSRVAALQKRWDHLRAGLDLVLQQRGADMANVPWGASGLLCRDFKGRGATTEVYRIDPGVVSLVAELRATSGRRPRNWSSGRRTTRSAG